MTENESFYMCLLQHEATFFLPCADVGNAGN